MVAHFKTSRLFSRYALMAVCLSMLTACTGLPKGIEPVSGFELDRYLGTWYEIARTDNRFERGLDNVTATYSLRDDGVVKVVNRGYKTAKSEWNSIAGRAKFVGDESRGHLKVAFFGPFYASYVVFKLEPDYEYAYVAGMNRRYLWLLSRTPEVSDDVRAAFVARAEADGFDVSRLIWPSHDEPDPD